MSYEGEYQPITELHCISNGLGSIALVELIRELLPARSSSIERANFIWVNEKKNQFVLYEEIERLWYKYSKSLDVSCVLEQDCSGSGLMKNSAFLQVRLCSIK